MATSGQSRNIVLINPNSSQAATTMMVSIARRALRHAHPCRAAVTGVTAGRDCEMITAPDALAQAAPRVVAAGREHLARGGAADAFIVAAFGDPGAQSLARESAIPTVGLAQAAILEAMGCGLRFGIATTTPLLKAAIDGRVSELGASGHYTGSRFTAGDPRELLADPETMLDRLGQAVEDCVRIDGAQAVIIGGGPLGEAALALHDRLRIPIIQPVPAACRRACQEISAAHAGTPPG